MLLLLLLLPPTEMKLLCSTAKEARDSAAEMIIASSMAAGANFNIDCNLSNSSDTLKSIFNVDVVDASLPDW